MKKIYKYTLIGLTLALSFSSCTESNLTTQPTDSMSGQTLLSTATNALVPLNGIYRSMYEPGWSTTGNVHQCFGITAYNLMAEVMGDDFIMGASGSGWFWFDAIYKVKSRYNLSSWRSYDLWNAYYTWISNSNYILSAEETMTGTTAEKNYVIGQAYAIRAYSYFMLEQCFARTLVGHENEKGVPIYKKPTFTTTTGQPRATNAEVYVQIDNDINKAVELLKGTKQQHKSHISYAVAQGIKARIALVKENWAEAAASAIEAINDSKCTILEVKDMKGMNDVSKSNVMWGAEIIADQSAQYASFMAHMDTVVGFGKNAPKRIAGTLYRKMGNNDARRAWWDPACKYSDANGYHQEKFMFSNPATWLGDYLWMRVEEMYLIAAEAYAHAGNDAEAQKYLQALMSKRDPDFNATKYTGNSLSKLTSESTGSLLDKIILERRIELWGEAGRVWDIRRLHQGFRRTAEMGWPSPTLLSNRPTDNTENYMWVLTIPQAEFDGNINMDSKVDQNPVGDL